MTKLKSKPEKPATLAKEWIVLDGTEVVYRGESCGDAVRTIKRNRLSTECLFTTSYVGGMLLAMLPDL